MESKVFRFCIDRSWGTVMGKVSPETFFTKICIVSATSGDADREIGDEERMASGIR